MTAEEFRAIRRQFPGMTQQRWGVLLGKLMYRVYSGDHIRHMELGVRRIPPYIDVYVRRLERAVLRHQKIVRDRETRAAQAAAARRQALTEEDMLCILLYSEEDMGDTTVAATPSP